MNNTPSQKDDMSLKLLTMQIEDVNASLIGAGAANRTNRKIFPFYMSFIVVMGLLAAGMAISAPFI